MNMEVIPAKREQPDCMPIGHGNIQRCGHISKLQSGGCLAAGID